MSVKEQSSKAKREKTASISCEGQVKWSSLQHQFAQVPKHKVSPFKGSIDAKFEDKITVVKNGKLLSQRGSDRCTAERRASRSTPLKSSKPWPGRKATTTVDELVKHMSNVPSYLQQRERGENLLQDKALNVGVLEWGLLERWTNQQRPSTNKGHGASPSSIDESLLFSALSSPVHSSASPSSSASQSKQSPANGHQRYSVKYEKTCLLGEHADNVAYSSRSITPVSSILPGHVEYLHSDNGSGDDVLRSSSASLPSDSILAASKSDETCNLVKTKESRTKREEMIHRNSTTLYADGDKKDCSCFTLSDNNESMCDHLQWSIDAMHIDFDSPVFSAAIRTEKNGDRPHGGFLEDIELGYQLLQVPFSCPLPHTNLLEELGASGTPPQKDFVGTTEEKGENVLQNRSSISSIEKQTKHDVRLNSTDGKTLLNHHLVAGLNRMNRSSSFKEAPSVLQPESIAPVDKISGDKSTANNKGRRSPLRRMLDPLLKPRNRPYSSGPIPSSCIHNSCQSSNTDSQPLRSKGSASPNQQCHSVDERINATSQTKGILSQSNLLLNSERYLRHEKHSTSTRQALLQLAWKNGLPLFMLSSGDTDILAATMRRKNTSDKDDVDSIYTIFTVEEPRRKNGVWIKTGNKSKKQHLVSNVVGQMRVSCSKSRCYGSKIFHVHREFVLVGSEPLPSSDGPGDSQVNRELAAIISKASHQMVEPSHGSSLLNSVHNNSISANVGPKACSCPPLKNSQPEWSNVISGAPSVIAILPSGFHGLSSSGEPSPLIERWKSGGACDCGGWDEGCMLTVLTDESRKCSSTSSVQACQAADGTRRFELSAQGRSREDGHAFSMISFKEGLYTVEFRAPIALLQAFVICIAMLHGRTPNKLQVGAEGSQMRAFVADHVRKTVAASEDRTPTSYVPYHPPLSPVGRA